MRGYFSIRRIIIEHNRIEKKTTENVMYFMASPPAIPSCSGTEARTAAANPLGIIVAITLLSKPLEDFGEKKAAIINLTTIKDNVISPPIIMHLKSEKGMLKPM